MCIFQSPSFDQIKLVNLNYKNLTGQYDKKSQTSITVMNYLQKEKNKKENKNKWLCFRFEILLLYNFNTGYVKNNNLETVQEFE